MGNEDEWREQAEFWEQTCREKMVEIERLQAFAESIGRCSCGPGLCDTKMDFQCRAREALDGIANQ